MTTKEAAKTQGMEELSFEGLPKNRVYEALGNAVDVDLVKLIIENFIKLGLLKNHE
jgi:site-specific DNA-cytosine methylase